jgi:hypothetical protein
VAVNSGWPRIEGGATLAPDPAVLRRWRSSRGRFYAVVLMLSDPVVEERRRRVANALHPWCRLTSPWQAHVTLAACGTSAPSRLPRTRLEVQVGGADSFTSAAFLAADSAAVHDLRREVLRVVPQEIDAEPTWVPHVTVGTYRWPMPAHRVADRLAGLREAPVLRAVGTLAVVWVDKEAGDGRLRLKS